MENPLPEIQTQTVDVSAIQFTQVPNPLGLPEWGIPPQSWDIIATMVLGVIAVWAKETWNHYDDKNPRITNLLKMARMIIPGIFAGFLGGELAGVTGNEEYTWLFALVIGYSGTPAMDMITEAVLGLMKKLMHSMSITPNEKSDTIKAYEEPKETIVGSTNNSTSSSANVVSNSSGSTPDKLTGGVPEVSRSEPLNDNSNSRGVLFGVKDTEHFKASEILDSGTAKKLVSEGRLTVEQTMPKPEQAESINWLMDNIIEPIRRDYGKPLRINSTFRAPMVNEIIGGSKTSDHMCPPGKAACDIEPVDASLGEDFAVWVWNNRMKYPIKQCIWEFPDASGTPSWIHLAGDRHDTTPNYSLLVAVKENGRTVYKPADETTLNKYNINV